MKALLKLIISLVIFVLILIFGLLFIVSGVNNTPIDLYTEEALSSNILNDKLNSELEKLGDDNSLNLHFTDEELNLLIFNVIRDNINSEYSPLLGTTDKEKYIYTYMLDDSISIIGGKSIHIYSAYSIIDEDSLTIEIPIDLFGIVDSKVSMDLIPKTNDDSFIFHINSLKLGKINLFGGIGTKILGQVNLENNSDSLIEFDFENKEIILKKEKLRTYLSNSMEDSDSVDSQFSKELISMMFNPEYKILNVNLDSNLLKLDVDLNALSIDKDKVIIDETIKKEFDSELFITNKTQNLMFSTLSNNNTNLTMSYNEINQLIYTVTLGYKYLCYTVPINDDITFNVNIEGIILNSKDELIYITTILNLNGMYTKVTIPCNIIKVSDTKIKLTISDKLTLGENASVSSSFIFPILEGSFNTIDILKYNNSDKSFTIDSTIIDSFLESNDITSNFEIKALNLSSLGLIVNIGFTTNDIQDKVGSLTNGLKDILSNDFVNSDLFDNYTNEEENINELLDTLNNIQNTLITDDTISESLTDKLIEDINNLSSESQKVIYDQIQNSLSSEDTNILESLYNDLFK